MATTATLARAELLTAADRLALPRVTRSVRTRGTQSGSNVDLTFVALRAESLKLPAGELMHRAALTEGLRTYPQVVEPGMKWRLVELKGRERLHLPDAEVVSADLNDHSQDCAVEFDASYDPEKVERKLRAFAAQGYRNVIWLTSVHGKVKTVTEQARDLKARGKLADVTNMVAMWVDFWSDSDDRYDLDRRRCKTKVNVASM